MPRKRDLRVANAYATPMGTAYDVHDISGDSGARQWYIATYLGKGKFRIINANANRYLPSHGPTGQAVIEAVQNHLNGSR